MKFSKLPVLGKLLIASTISSYATYSYLSNQNQNQKMATKSCTEECRPTAQQLKLYCPPSRKFIVTGNWKMNGNKKMVEEMMKILWCGPIAKSNEVIIGFPAPYLEYAHLRKPKAVEIAGENIYKEGSGPYTGEISADMLVDLGLKWVILGASERKHYFHEDYEFIAEKVKYAIEQGLKVVLCVGETAGQRDCDEQIKVILAQLATVQQQLKPEQWKNIIITYEPQWVVNTTKTLTPEEAQEVCKAIRTWVKDNIDPKIAGFIRIQYGGPMTPENVKPFTKGADIDGLYVSSFSMKPEFLDFINAKVT